MKACLLSSKQAFCFYTLHKMISNKGLFIYFANKRIKMKIMLGKSVFDLLYARTFPGSSVVEQLTVNQLVAGSNPARGATFTLKINVIQFELLFSVFKFTLTQNLHKNTQCVWSVFDVRKAFDSWW